MPFAFISPTIFRYAYIITPRLLYVARISVHALIHRPQSLFFTSTSKEDWRATANNLSFTTNMLFRICSEFSYYTVPCCALISRKSRQSRDVSLTLRRLISVSDVTLKKHMTYTNVPVRWLYKVQV